MGNGPYTTDTEIQKCFHNNQCNVCIQSYAYSPFFMYSMCLRPSVQRMSVPSIHLLFSSRVFASIHSTVWITLGNLRPFWNDCYLHKTSECCVWNIWMGQFQHILTKKLYVFKLSVLVNDVMAPPAAAPSGRICFKVFWKQTYESWGWASWLTQHDRKPRVCRVLLCSLSSSGDSKRHEASANQIESRAWAIWLAFGSKRVKRVSSRMQWVRWLTRTWLTHPTCEKYQRLNENRK